MQNWKTTVTGILSACGQVMPFFGVPSEVGQAVSVIGLALLGLFSHDAVK